MTGGGGTGQAPAPAEPAAGAAVDVARLTELVRRLMLAEVRREQARRGSAGLPRA